jgi:uncharacterized membrane protein HdeD (DUF308 family)
MRSRYDRFLDQTARTEKRFPWGLWALIGAVAWLLAMVALGTPILAILAPVAGVLLGWIAGGIVYLVTTSFRT